MDSTYTISTYTCAQRVRTVVSHGHVITTRRDLANNLLETDDGLLADVFPCYVDAYHRALLAGLRRDGYMADPTTKL